MTKTKVRIVTSPKKPQNQDSQSEGLIPGGVEATFDGLGLLLALTFGIWDQLELDVGV